MFGSKRFIVMKFSVDRRVVIFNIFDGNALKHQIVYSKHLYLLYFIFRVFPCNVLWLKIIHYV